jgi:hypothetical protein
MTVQEEHTVFSRLLWRPLNRFDSWNTLNSSVASAAKRVALTFLLAGSVRGNAGTSFGARWIGATVVQNYLEGEMN